MSDQPAPTTRSARRAEQDQRLANDITAAQQMIATAQNDSEIVHALETRSINAAAFAQGLAFALAAQDKFTARQIAVNSKKAATAALDQAVAAARALFTEYRATARIAFSDRNLRATLGASGLVSADNQKFITFARAACAAAEAYQGNLYDYGFTAEKLAALRAALDACSEAQEAQNGAVGAAQSATAARDTAYAELKGWVKHFAAVARLAFRTRRDLLAKLNL